MENSNHDNPTKPIATSKSLASFIDHTLLKPESTPSDILQLCQVADTYGFFSVCVCPHYVELARQHLAQSQTKVCTVVGFPNGYSTLKTKAFETSEAIGRGADEIDMVINIGALKGKDHDYLRQELMAVRNASMDHVLKVIIETTLLSEEEKTAAASLVRESGADFVKTSTGFAGGGATLEDVRLLRSVVGPTFGVKASGGIKDFQTAQAMIEAGATRLGTSSSIAIVTNTAADSMKGNY